MNPSVLIPDHELLRRIGRGSYGDVWLARNVMGQGRAVKIVRRDAFESSRPFEREFAAIRRYEPVSRQAEGLVNVLHVGRNDPEGVFYYVMELADAMPQEKASASPDQPAAADGDASYAPHTLSAELAARKRLTPSGCLEIAISLSQALGTLHRAGLVHRDIKPSNIIFVHGQAKLADIGLVGELGESRSFVGTEGYIPPEGPGQPSADFYALGRVLYEALTGEEPRRFPLLSAAAMEQLGAPEAQELMEVLLRSGESDAARRYQSAEAMLADLAIIRSGRSVRRLHAMEQRWRIVKRGGAAVLLLLLLAGGGWLLAMRQAQRERDLRQTSERSLALARRASARLAASAGEPGARAAWLAALADSRGAEEPLGLRDEFIAALSRSGLREVCRIPCPLTSPAPGIAADCRHAAVPREDGAVLLCDTDSGRVLTIFENARCHPLWPLRIDSTGTLLAIHGSDDVLRLWQSGRSGPVMELPGAAAAEFLPGRNALAVRWPDCRTTVHDTSTGSELHSWPWPDASVIAFQSSADGEWLMAYSEAGHAILTRHARTGEAGPSVPLRRSGDSVDEDRDAPAIPTALSWPSATAPMLLGLSDGRLFRWHPDQPDRLLDAGGHSGQITGIAHAGGAGLIATTSWDRTTRIADASTGLRLLVIRGWGKELGLSPDGARFVRHDAVAKSLVVHAVERTPMGRSILLQPQPGGRSPGEVNGVAFSPDGQWIAAGHNAGIHLMTNEGVALTSLLLDHCSSVAFPEDAGSLWAASLNGLYQYPLLRTADRTGVSLGPPEQRSAGPCFRMALSGSMVSFTVNYQPVLLTGSTTSGLAMPAEWHSTSLSPDGKWAAFGSKAGGAQLWQTDSPGEPHRLPGPGEWTQTAFSRDGRGIFVGSSAGVSRYGVPAGPEEWHVHSTGSGGAVAHLAASPDGLLLAAVLDPGHVTLIHAGTGQRLATLPGPDGLDILSLAFSPGGETIAAGLRAPLVHLWDLRTIRTELRAHALDWTDAPIPAPPPSPAGAGRSRN